ncbi:MAG: zinc dependent phospholipase C family protein [Candidatus Heimdallarchaeota archaeon]|nr:zinc dependent phospholipase C family protein [Candidatus Heimdallarchaeota archaeon]
MRKFLIVFVALLLFQFPTSSAWGYSVHTEVTQRTAELIPGEYGSFINNHLDEILKKSLEPDQIKSKDPAEGPRHFDDSDIPHRDMNISWRDPDYRLGVISWAILNTTYDLATAIFHQDEEKMIHYLGYLAHYAADSTQPLHATSNFDGYETGNGGIHSRFEVDLVSRYFDDSFANSNFTELKVVDPYNETKDILSSGLALVDDIMEADDIASSQGTDDNQYYEILWNLTSSIVQSRLNLAIQHAANLWFTAYSLATSDEAAIILKTTETITKTSVIVSTVTVLDTIGNNNSTFEESPYWFLPAFFMVILVSRKRL